MYRILSAEDPETKSLDIIRANVGLLSSMFPEVVSEGKVDFDALRQLLGGEVDERHEKYGLNWNGKRLARQIALTPSTGTLRPCPEDSVDWDTTQNLVIEGDNLEVLKLLQKSYAGKVKLIYIDPPYNTGSDFVYPDNFKDNIRNYLELTGQVEGGAKMSSNTEASGRFHTDWLNMMYPRLKLARDLLQPDGCLFVTIDDGEVHNLRHALCDVFGDENFIANVIWEKKYTRANDAQFFSDNHDHILVFARSRQDSALFLQPRSAKQEAAYSNPDNHPKGLWKATPLHAKSGVNRAPYTFSCGVQWAPPPGTYRRYSDETMASMDAANEIWFGTDGGSTPARKSFLTDVKQGITPVTIWPHEEVGHNHEANSEVKALVGGGVFDNPKPVRLLQRMVQLGTSSNDVVLDFFAGSGTTGHAVMAQNAADGGNRRYILVQLPEPLDPANKDQKTAAEFCDKLGKPRNIAELTKERLRRAGAKIREELKARREEPEGKVPERSLLPSDDETIPSSGSSLLTPDTGFRVFKLDSTNIREWEPDRDNLDQTLLDSIDHLKDERTEADILYELLLKLGLDLCVAIEKKEVRSQETEGGKGPRVHTVHAIGGGVLMACLSEHIGREDVEPLGHAMVEWHKSLAPAGDTTCVFRDAAFADDVAKTNLAAILEQNGITTVRSL